MRIAMAAPLYAPDFQGGAVRVCRQMVRGLRDRRHAVSIFAGRATADEPLGRILREEVDGVPSWRVNVGNALAPFSPQGYANDASRDAFAAFVETNRPDLLHVHGLQGLGIAPLQVAAAEGIPVVLTMHDWWWLCPCLFRLSPADAPCPSPVRAEVCSKQSDYDFCRREEIVAAGLSLVDQILVPSAFLRNDLVANGLPADRIRLSPNGIAPPSETAIRPGVANPGEPLRVVFFGGAGNREKGLGDLLVAASELAPASCRFTLYATSSEEVDENPDLLAVAAFPSDRIDVVLAEADVLVVPSRMRESFSLATREALARGVPVVATECGGPEEVIRDGVNGFLVPTGEPRALALALTKLAGDRDRLDSLAAAARKTGKELRTIEEQVGETAGVYNSVLERRARRRSPPRSRVLEATRVLFLSGCDGAPFRYRVRYVAESLSLLGVESRALYHSDVQVLNELQHADVLILFRTPFSAAVLAAIAAARRRRMPVIYAADDLIFHPDRLRDAPALGHPDPDVARGFADNSASCALAAAVADAFVGSTPELADAAHALGLPAFTVPNSAGSSLVAASKVVDPVAEFSPSIGFFSGTDTHDADLAVVADSLAAVLERFPRLEFVLGGPVSLPDRLRVFENRIRREAVVGWSSLPQALASVSINLLPLDTTSGFNRAKSDVKFLEASLVGVPTLGSRFPALVAGTDQGRLARLADGAPAWGEALGEMISDDDRRRRLGAAARAGMLRDRTSAATAEAWGSCLEEVLAGVPRSEVELPLATPMEAGGASQVSLEPADLFTGAEQLGALSGEALLDAATVEQEIACSSPGARRVDVCFGTYARSNRQEILIEVYDQAERLRGVRNLRGDQLVDRAFVGVELVGPEPDVTAETLRVRIRSRGARAGNEVLLWRAPSTLGGLRIGGREVPGETLCFRVFTDPPALARRPDSV